MPPSCAAPGRLCKLRLSMARNDIYSLRQVLRRAILAAGRPLRELEDAIGVRHGNLRLLMDGDAEIRIVHLLGLARYLGVPAAKRRLRNWIGAEAEPGAPPPAPFPTTAAELERIVQTAVERALAGRSPRAAAQAPAASDLPS
jgi:hypothetical protein